MSSYIELRVHGVSGTTAETLLGVKEVEEPVAGDSYVRFVRPTEPSPPEADAEGRKSRDHERVLEGMTWGQLTSGKVLQATWLLLLPFSLVNLAYWARPWRRWGMLSAAYAWIIRIIGLSLTVTITFTAASASMDLLAWQCVIGDRQDCLQANGWLGFTSGWSAGTVLAVAALLPTITVLGLTVLSHRTSLRYEMFRAGPLPEIGTDDPDLFHRDMWRGDVLVRKLRVLHAGIGVATTATVLARGSMSLNTGGTGDRLASVALGTALTVIVLCALLCRPSRSMSWSSARRGRNLPSWIVYGGSALALALATAAALASDITPVDGLGDQGHLAGIIAFGQILCIVQVLLLFLLATVFVLARLTFRARFGLPDRVDGASLTAAGDWPKLALWGCSGWFIAAGAVILGFAYSAGVVYRVSAQLTQPGPASTQSLPVPAFEIAAVAAGVFLLVLIALLGGLFLSVLRQRTPARASVLDDYAMEMPEQEVGDYRVNRAITPRAVAASVSIDRLRWILVSATTVGLLAAVYSLWDAFGHPGSTGTSLNTVRATAYESDVASRVSGRGEPPHWVGTAVRVFGDVGAWAVTGFALGLIALGAIAWRNDKARRSVGILWDIVSFFPRAGHPLAPPCYAERAVPQLTSRLGYLTRARTRRPRTVVLAGHSQGSVLAVAALAQLNGQAEEMRHLGLLTFGSPIRRLYTPVFPRLFWPDELNKLAVAQDQRWTNLYRPTDPIGGSLHPVLSPALHAMDTPRAGDLRLRDPERLRMVPRTSAYAPVHGHRDYYADPCYREARVRLVAALEPAATRPDPIAESPYSASVLGSSAGPSWGQALHTRLRRLLRFTLRRT